MRKGELAVIRHAAQGEAAAMKRSAAEAEEIRKAETEVAVKALAADATKKSAAGAEPVNKFASEAEAAKESVADVKCQAADTPTSSVKRARKKPLVFATVAG